MDYEEIKKLINDMGNSNIDELNIEFPDGIKIGMKKSAKNNINEIETQTYTFNQKEKSNTITETKKEEIENYKIVKISNGRNILLKTISRCKRICKSRR